MPIPRTAWAVAIVTNGFWMLYAILWPLPAPEGMSMIEHVPAWILVSGLATIVTLRIMLGGIPFAGLVITCYIGAAVWNVFVVVRDADLWSLIAVAGGIASAFVLWRLTQTDWWQDRPGGRVRPVARGELAVLLAVVFCSSILAAYIRTPG